MHADGEASADQAEAAASCVCLEDLEFGYAPGGFTLRLPWLRFARGQSCAITGPSGCGKTSLLLLIAGILRPLRGRVRVLDVDLAALGEAARRRFRIQHLGHVFQSFELLEHLNVRDNILLPYLVQPGLRLDARVRARADELARAVGVQGLLGRWPRTLSHGEQQRVAICRALVTEPRIVLADEPTGNLDPMYARTVIDLLLRLARERGVTLLAVTHDLSLVPAFDRTLDLAALAAGGTP